MQLLLTVVEIVAPIFLVALAGFVWVRLGYEFRLQFVTRLAMNLSLPCLIFVALMQTKIDPAALTRVTLVAMATQAAIIALIFILVKVLHLDTRTYMAPLMFGNTGNLGLPLALFAFGETGLAYGVVIFAVSIVWSFTFGIWLVSGGASITKLLRDPLFLGTVLGALFLWQGWETPQALTRGLDLIGQMAIPLMLVTLGVAVGRLEFRNLGRPLLLSFIKLILCAGAAWVIGQMFGLDKVAFGVLVLQAATPVAVTSYLLAERHGADADAVAGLVLVSTLLAVFALPVILALVL